MNKIFKSDNYIVIDLAGVLTVFPSSSTYTESIDSFLLKSEDEDFIIGFSEVATFFNEAGDTAFSELTLRDFFTLNTGSGGGGGAAATPEVLAFQDDITVATTVLIATQKGLNKIFPFNRETAQTVQVNAGVYVKNDVINIERRGNGTLEVLFGAGVKFRGKRDINNRYFANDTGTGITILCRGNEEFSIVGNTTPGHSGPVTTVSYTSLSNGDVAVNIIVIGTGFSDNTIVTVVSGNATLNSFAPVSGTQMTLDMTETGVIGDKITIGFDNGQVFTDTDAITIVELIPNANLVRYYRFNDDAIDQKGLGNGTETDITYVAGKSGNAADFNGSTSIITVPDAADLSFAGTPFSISLLVKFDVLPTSNGIIIEKQTATTDREWILFYAGSLNLMRFQIQSPSGALSIQCDDDVTSYTTGTFFHIVVTNNGSNDASGSKFYLDGVLISTTNTKNGAYVGMTAGPADVRIGARAGAINELNGPIDGLGIWNIELSQSQITAIFDRQNIGNELL